MPVSQPGLWSRSLGKCPSCSSALIDPRSLVPSRFEGSSDERSSWMQIWHSASRSLSNPSTSRCAAHLMNSLLQSDFVSESDAANLIESTFFSNGLNGPVGFSDAALQLWSTILSPSGTSHQTVAGKIVLRFINWLSSYYQLSPHS